MTTTIVPDQSSDAEARESLAAEGASEPTRVSSNGNPSPSGRSTPRRLSASALSSFRICPKRFSLDFIERRNRYQEPSSNLAIGNAVHHALERFYGLPLEVRSPELLERALRAVWPQHRRGIFLTRDEEADAGRRALELLAGYAARFDLDAVPLAREQWLSTRLPNGIELFGKLDRIDPVGELVSDPAFEDASLAGGIEVIDYKTGRTTLDDDELPGESSAQVYLLLADASFPKRVERIRFIFLGSGDQAIWHVDPDDVELTRERLVALTDEIVTTDEFPAFPGDQCRFCRHALACPERQRVNLDELVPVEGLPF